MANTSFNNVDIILLLLKYGASIDCLDYEEYTPLDYAPTKKLQGVLKKAAKEYLKSN